MLNWTHSIFTTCSSEEYSCSSRCHRFI